MALEVGTRLGPFEVTGSLRAGGPIAETLEAAHDVDVGSRDEEGRPHGHRRLHEFEELTARVPVK